MSEQEMPIFTRTFDFLTWLLPATNHFPRAHRFTFTQRLLDAAFELRERLTIHPAAQPRPVGEGIPFLGFTVFPQRRRLKRRKGIYFRRKLGHLIAAYEAGQIPLETVTASVQGWINHVRYGNTVGLRTALLDLPLKPPPRRPTHDL